MVAVCKAGVCIFESPVMSLRRTEPAILIGSLRALGSATGAGANNSGASVASLSLPTLGLKGCARFSCLCCTFATQLVTDLCRTGSESCVMLVSIVSLLESLSVGSGGKGFSFKLTWLGGTGVGAVVDHEKALMPGRNTDFFCDLICATAGWSVIDDRVCTDISAAEFGRRLQSSTLALVFSILLVLSSRGSGLWALSRSEATLSSLAHDLNALGKACRSFRMMLGLECASGAGGTRFCWLSLRFSS